ncbi:MAG: C1 family peptidase [Bacillota bacterium]|nr:C1 family peptidase [Bacillota bacterium]
MLKNMPGCVTRILTYVVICMVFLSAFPIVYAQDNTKEEAFNYRGLREPTEGEKNWAKKHMLLTRQINLNPLGLDRVNEKRKAKKKNLYKAELAVPVGQEVEANSVNTLLENNDGAAVNVGSTSDTLYAAGDLPDYVDNSKLDYFPPIRNQNPLNSCASFSTTYYVMTYMTALARGWNEKNNSDNTNKFSPKWTYSMINGGSDGGASIYGAYQVMINHGAATWADMPYDSNYTQWSTNADVWAKALNYKADKTGVVKYLDTPDGLNNLKTLLTNGYILNYATGITSWKFTTIKDDPSTQLDDSFVGASACFWADGNLGPHAMTVVGYNDNIWVDINNNGVVDSGEKGALRIANSWGTTWKEKGFSWVAYDALKTTSAVSGGPSTNRVQVFTGAQANWITAKPQYTPKLLAQFTVNHAKRNQMVVSLGYSDTTQTTPTKTWNSYALYNKGGALGFNGTADAVNATFVLDYTDLINANAIDIKMKKRWYLKIGDSSKDGVQLSILDFKLKNNLTGEIVNSSASFPIQIDGVAQSIWIDYADSGTTATKTATPTSTTIATPTPTAVVTPTMTKIPIQTATAINTQTQTPTSTKYTTQTPTPTILTTQTPTSTRAPTPTPTATSTATPTLTATPTQIPTATPTTATEKVKLTGYVKSAVDSFNELINDSFKVEIEGQNTYVSTDKSGYFEIDAPVSAALTYYLDISKGGYLTKHLVVNNAGMLNSMDSPFIILPGDVDGNNSINMADVIEIAKCFNKVEGDIAYNRNCDFDLDKVVNMHDIIYIARTFNYVEN